MTTRIIGKGVLAICIFSTFGCANTETEEDSYQAERKRPVSAEQAAKLLGCGDDDVAVCIQTSCELEEYYCTEREDVRKMFKAGEFRHD